MQTQMQQAPASQSVTCIAGRSWQLRRKAAQKKESKQESLRFSAIITGASQGSSPELLVAHLGGKAFQAASSAMEASMLWMSCRRSRESFSRYTRLFRTAAAYWEKVVSWLLLAASAASLVRLAAHPEPGNVAVQVRQIWLGKVV